MLRTSLAFPALEAKRAGQIEQAKEYLRQAKGFDKLIEATKCGLPVDINTIPIPPQDTKGQHSLVTSVGTPVRIDYVCIDVSFV